MRSGLLGRVAPQGQVEHPDVQPARRIAGSPDRRIAGSPANVLMITRYGTQPRCLVVPAGPAWVFVTDATARQCPAAR
jgi:hypothetical protein